MIDRINKVQQDILNASVFNSEMCNEFAEAFTPPEWVDLQLDKYDPSIWSDKTKTNIDFCAGKGNYPIRVILRFFNGLADVIPDEEERLRHIVENQIFMCEMQDTSANFIAYYFQFGLGFKVNLYRGDSLLLPEDFFDLSWDERREKYPQHCVLEPVEPKNLPEILVESPSLPRSERVSKPKVGKTPAKVKKPAKTKRNKYGIEQKSFDGYDPNRVISVPL